MKKTKKFFQKFKNIVYESPKYIHDLTEDIKKIQNNHKLEYYSQSKQNNSLLNKVNSILMTQQKSAFEQLVQNIQKKSQHIDQSQQPSPLLQNKQKLQLMGQQLQKYQKYAPMKKIQSKSSLLQVKQYIHDLQNKFAQKYQQDNIKYKHDNINNLFQMIIQIYENNKYLSIQLSFDRIKQMFFHHQTPYKNTSSKRLLNSGNQHEFNLQLTMKSKLSKNSINFQRQDSLIYSNATSFGLNSTKNNSRSKQLRNTGSKGSRRNNHDDIDMIVIDKTSSRGSVENNQERFSSARSISDNEKALKLPPKMIYENKSDRSRQSMNNSEEDQKNSRKKTDFSVQSVKSPIKEEDNYMIGQFSSNKKQKQKLSNSNIKKTFSIKSHSKMSNSRTKSIKGEQASVFSAQMQQLQSRISKIKDTKLLKRKKLQEQLAKINRQIQQIKKQQQKVQQKKIIPQNTLQSRIQINNDHKSKKMAVNLVRNLKIQKESRQKKRRQIKVLDQGLHQQMKQIMQLRYFNEQRVKQKRKLEIIERMKKQQMRKIQQQKQIHATNQFLMKIKQQNQLSAHGLSQVKQNKIIESPIKRSAKKQSKQKQITETNQTPIIQKRKVNIHKVRNLHIIKKAKEDIYQQALY